MRFRLGLEGSGHDRYAAYLPFVLAPGAEISVEGSSQLENGQHQLKLERLQHLYALSSWPFPKTEEAAKPLKR